MDAIKQAKETRRNRFVVLAGIAKEVCDLLDARGVTQNEGCKVRRMAEDMWQDNYNLSVSNVECCAQPEMAVR